MQLPQLLITILIALGIPLTPEGELPAFPPVVHAEVTVEATPSATPAPTATPSATPTPTPTPSPTPKPPKDASCSGKLKNRDHDANFWGKFSSWWHKDHHDDNKHDRGNRGRNGGRR